ncbi:MAG: hypothetical protein BroJett039_06400 [Chloroflexota bacterium]|nr:MAG: hypothetical protein BroJett039_06400 [Chloroflexota bacterium]
MACYACGQTNRPNAHFCAQCAAPLQLQDKYRIVRLLGRGGYGAVYEAEHHQLGAHFAIKELFYESYLAPAQRQAASEQFNTEAKILANLNFAMLPKVSDYFTERGRDYLVMEFIPGDTLEEYLAKTNAPIPEAQVLKWADELCDALIYLHSQNPPVIHRDIKPSNIKITPGGKLMLLDFGISKLLTVGAKTGTSARAGTPPYTPLEQYGTGTDERSDIYALGIVMYEMLTKQKPPEAPDRVRLAVTPPRQINPNVSASTEALVLKAMADKPEERFQNAVEIQNAIRNPEALVPSLSVAQANAQVVSVSSNRPRAVAFPLWTIPVALLLIAGLGFLAYNIGETTMQTNVTATAQALNTQAALVAKATGTAQAQGTSTTQAELVATRNAQGTATSNAARTLIAQSNANATNAAIRTTTAVAAMTKTSIRVATEQAAHRATDISNSVQQTTIAMQATNEANSIATVIAFQSTVQAPLTATASAVARETQSARETSTARAIVIAEQTRRAATVAQVASTADWQSTGVSLLTGSRITIEVIDGVWTYWKGNQAYTRGDGSGLICTENLPAASCDEPVPDFLKGALVGRVGEHLFGVGSERTIVIGDSGILELRINDIGLDDNDGVLTVRITKR